MNEIDQAFQNWADRPGNLHGGMQFAFQAGAAWMAQQFASGQGLKVEQLPRKYVVKYQVGFGPDSLRSVEMSGFTDEEVKRELLRRYEYQSEAVWIMNITPAEVP